jgi:enoyl-CoA hydratase/carnithine racemase
LEVLEKELVKNELQNIEEVIQSVHVQEKKPLTEFFDMNLIENIFSKGSVEEIMELLNIEHQEQEKNNKNSKWIENIILKLNTMSPTSLKVVHEQITRGKKLDLAQCFKMELKIAEKMLLGKDFFEGVRALLIDKDKNPKWNPSNISEVKKEEIDEYFK